jgi:hypothetical protein
MHIPLSRPFCTTTTTTTVVVVVVVVRLLLRSDGLVDVTRGFGKVDETHACDEAGVTFVAINRQHAAEGDENDDGSNCSNYLIRSDGSVLRLAFGKKQSMPAPDGAQYIAACAMQTASYLLRDDGAVDRTKGHAQICHTMMPPVGLRYVSVSAGRHATYLLRSDGRIDRTTGHGKVDSTLEVPSQTTIAKEHDDCVIC